MIQKVDSLNYSITLVRLVLGVVLVVASWDKILDPDAFARSILNYKIVGITPALITATVLPWMELLTGLGLILGIFVRGSSLLAVIMFTGFTVAVVSALWRGLDISCGCFSQDPNAGKIGWRKVAENGILIAMSVLSLWLPDEGFFVGPFVKRNLFSRAKAEKEMPEEV